MSDTGRSVYDQAVRWLSRRAYGEVELTRRLASCGFAPEGIAQAVARCRELGYLDDRAFAESRARVRLNRGYGPERVRAELLFLGVDAEHIEAALQLWQSGSERDAVTCALQVLEKRFGPVNGAQLNWRDRQRYYAFLARRGFSAEVIAGVLADES